MTEFTDREDEWRLRASIEHKRRSVAEQELEKCQASLLAQRQSTNELQRQLSAAWKELDKCQRQLEKEE